MKKIIIFFVATLSTLNIAYATDNSIYDYFASGTTHDMDFSAFTNNLLGILTWIGFLIATCIILITGIQFLTGNAQKRAQLKEKLWWIVLGVIVLAAGIPLFKLLFSVINDFKTYIG